MDGTLQRMVRVQRTLSHLTMFHNRVSYNMGIQQTDEEWIPMSSDCIPLVTLVLFDRNGIDIIH